MSMTFTKLFSSITESTVWCEPDPTRITWIAMLAMADAKGRVWASIPGLANRARVSVEEVELAINTFLSPDKYSRTPENEGRRIEVIDGGWRLLNYEKYRAIRDAESAKESKREYINKRRAAEREAKAKGVENVERGRTASNQAEEEAEAIKDLVVSDDTTRRRPSDSLSCPHQEVIDLYHQKLPTCTPIVAWGETRRKTLQVLWREKAAELKWKTKEDGLQWFSRYFDFVAESDFLTGKAEGRNGGKPFVANLEWIIKPANRTNIVEGKYHA